MYKICDEIYDRIVGLESDSVFIASDFSDIADMPTVYKVLSRLEKQNKIKKIFAGIYYNPVYSILLNEYELPAPHNVAMAIARKLNWTIAPSGNTALNQLGLSTQVSAKWSYISDGPYKVYRFNNVEIEFKRRNNKEISHMSYKSAMVIQALKELKKENIDQDIIIKLKKVLTSDEKKILLEECKRTTSWVYDVIKKICM